MSVYMILEIEVHDQDMYDEYKRQVPPLVEKHGGRYLVRGGAIVPLAGDWTPERIVVLEFPDFESMKAFGTSPEYLEVAALRINATTSRSIGVAGHGHEEG